MIAIGAGGGTRTGSGDYFKIHYSAITTPLPEANSLITNECQHNQAFLHVCQAPAITHPTPINYSPITRLKLFYWHFHWHLFWHLFWQIITLVAWHLT